MRQLGEIAQELPTDRKRRRSDGQPECLIILMDGEARVHLLPKQGSIKVGRSATCDIRIEDASVSREHALLHVDPLRVEDLRSKTGTLVNGQALAAHDRVLLELGHVITVGPAQIVVQGSSEGTTRGSPIMAQLYAHLDRVANTTISVLITGETGTGKEVLAQRIHDASNRRSRPYKKINCAAIPEALLESELFGYEKGAFTGALARKEGVIEAADGGTLFLDEIGDMPLNVQAKLLRVVECRELLRVGSTISRKVDVRFLTATNRNLKAMVRTGKFRQDLLYRLNGFTLRLPPLRDRREEIIPLAHRFLEQVCQRMSRSIPLLSETAIQALVDHDWPGNIRELKSTIERSILFAEGTIDAAHLQIEGDPIVLRPEGEIDLPLGQIARGSPEERDRIEAALRAVRGNQTEAARLLGVSRRTLLERLDIHNLPRPRKT
jgi:transcriptional regulator with PAS, ATPase and Fis domain